MIKVVSVEIIVYKKALSTTYQITKKKKDK
jgi:hypothetical protein